MIEYKRSPLLQCYHAIADRVDSGHECTYPESVVLKIIDAIGIIGNGSFQYFFENQMDADETAEAMNAIGETTGAEVILRAKELFPDGSPHEDFDERLKFMQDHTDEFDALGRQVMLLEKRIDEQLITYAVRNGLMSK